RLLFTVQISPNVRATLQASTHPRADIPGCGCRRDALAKIGGPPEDLAMQHHAAAFRRAGPRPNRAMARAAIRLKECQILSSAGQWGWEVRGGRDPGAESISWGGCAPWRCVAAARKIPPRGDRAAVRALRALPPCWHGRFCSKCRRANR